MADISINRAYRQGDAIVVEGTGFTRTTSTFTDADDDTQLDFEVTSETEVRIQDPERQILTLIGSKGEIETEEVVVEDEEAASIEAEAEDPYKTQTPDTIPGDVTKDDQTADASVEDLADAANAGAASKPPTQEATLPDVEPLPEGEHLGGENFRGRVENTAAGDLNMDPRQPYPTGNPPDPEDEFERIHGYRRGTEQEAQMDADPKT